MPIAEILETLMIISFGVSWPVSIKKSYTSRSTQGKSVIFLFCIFFGYICGIVSKILSNNLNLAFWFYIPNIIMVGTDICLYYRNRRIEEGTAKEAKIAKKAKKVKQFS